MRRRLVLPVSVILLLTATVLAVHSQTPAPAPAPASLKIGFVDMVRVLQSCKQFKTYQAGQEKLIQKLQQDEKAKEDELRLLNADLQKTDRLKYPEKWNTTRDDFIGKKAIYDIFQKQKDSILMEQRLRDMREVLDDISDEITSYGKEQGYFAIFKTDVTSRRAPRLAAQIEAELGGVIYSDAAADVTEEILKRMNGK